MQWRLLLTMLIAAFVYLADLPPTLAKSRVLVLHPYSDTLPASLRVANAVRKRLDETFGDDLDLYSEYLELSRFPGDEYQRRLGDYLAEKYKSKPISLTVALGAFALNFALSQRHAFGTDTPIVYCCVRSSRVANLTSAPNIFGVLSDSDVRKTVDLAMRLQPDARQLIAISGASEIDRVYQNEARRSIEGYSSQLQIQYLTGLPRVELIDRVSTLPRDTIVLFLTYLTDATGQEAISQEMAATVAQTASAPTYAIFDTMMGTGVVGGYMDTFEGAGVETADLAIQVLQGRVPIGESIRRRNAHDYYVDARQLDRWNLPRTSLPPETILKFEKPSIWQTHRREVVAAIAAFSIVSLAVVLLLAQVRRRMKVEAHLMQSEERLNFAAASGGVGLWQYDVRKGQLWSSEHCRSIFGLPPDSPLTVEMLLDRVHPQDRRLADASIHAATTGPSADACLDLRVLRPGGEIRFIRSRSHSTLDGEGNALRVSGTFLDLTAYRSIQKQAKELSRRILSIQDEERQRIAQELHDSTAQHLAAINLNLSALHGTKPRLGRDAPIFADIQASLVAAMNEMRTFTYLLYPQELAQSGLHETLTRYVEGYGQRTGLAVNLRMTRELDELAHDLKHSLLRILQESLANVYRHASATVVAIRLQRLGNRLHLLIADNGVGIPGAPAYDRDDIDALPLGVGIPGMTARARQLGGELQVRSRKYGTLVHASLPITYEDSSPTSSALQAKMTVNGERRVVESSMPIARRALRIVPKRADRTKSVREYR